MTTLTSDMAGHGADHHRSARMPRNFQLARRPTRFRYPVGASLLFSSIPPINVARLGVGLAESSPILTAPLPRKTVFCTRQIDLLSTPVVHWRSKAKALMLPLVAAPALFERGICWPERLSS